MLATLLEWVEDFGATTVLARDVDASLTRAERDVLGASGVLRDAPPAKTLPCEEHGDCAREVRANAPRAKLPRVAVCTREPPGCAARDVTHEEIAQRAIDVDALVHILATVSGIEVVRAVRTDARVRPGDPQRLGRMGGDAACELFFVRRPDETALAAFLAARDRAGAATRVLVPTARRVSPAILARGDVVALSDALAVERGVLALRGVARAPHLRLVAGRAAKASATTTMPAIASWDDVAFAMIDNHTVRVRTADAAARRTYHDFGMASDRNRKPKRAWTLFIGFCENNGVFKGKGMGSVDVVTRLVSTLRADLKRVFAIDESPIADYAGSVGWVARFRVEDENPPEE